MKSNNDKKLIRTEMKKFRMSLSNEEYSYKNTLIYNKIINSEWYQNADTILIYVSFKNEVDTKNIIENSIKLGKAVAVPKIINGEMKFYYIDSLDELESGYFGVQEPKDISRPFEKKSEYGVIMLVPGLAFDKNNNRLGYGGGFYDRFLEKYEAFTVALCFKEQVLETIPTDKYDKRMDVIITD